MRFLNKQAVQQLLAQRSTVRARGRRAVRTAGQGTGSLSYVAAQQLRALLARFVVKAVDPVDEIPSTAFFVNDKAFLLTCWHIVEPDFAGVMRDWVWVEYRGKRYKADVLKEISNRNKDLAVLRVQGEEFQRLQQNGLEVAPLAFPYQPADPIAALGYQRQDVLVDPLLLRGYIDPDNTPLAVPLVDAAGMTFALQQCLAVVFRHVHFDFGVSGAPLLNTRTGCVVGIVAGVLPSHISAPYQPLGFAVPLADVPISWSDFVGDCDVLNYETVLDQEILQQSREFPCHESFTERPQWAAHVRDFLDDPQRRSGYLLLVGGEGEGKSAFMAHYVQNTIEPIFHFIRRTEPGWDNPERMLHSMTAQLLRKHGVDVNEMRRERLSSARSDEERIKAASEIFADVLERVSRVLVAEGEKEVLWIDGLDEAFGPTGRYHDTPGLPGLFPAQLPPGIYAVLTSRPGDHLHWLRDPTLCVQYRLEDEQDKNITDVERYFTEHAQDVVPPLDRDFIVRAAKKTQGNFYIAVYQLADIKREPTAPRDPNAIPSSVKDYHAEVYNRVVARTQREGIAERDVRFVLGLMAEAREPLTLEHLDAFKVPDHAEQILTWAADYFRQRLPQRAPRLPFEFNHTSVPEFLSQQLTSVERQTIHRHLADACADWCNLAGDARLYALRRLPTHLWIAKMWNELCDVLTDFDYLQASSIIPDHYWPFELALYEMPATHPMREQVKALYQAIRDEYILKQEPKLLVQQLYNKFVWDWDETTTLGRSLRKAAERCERIWLKRLNRETTADRDWESRLKCSQRAWSKRLKGEATTDWEDWDWESEDADNDNGTAFSPNGKRAASRWNEAGLNDGMVRLWDTRGSQRAKRFLFNVGLEFQIDLEQGVLSVGFRKEFEAHGISLSEDVAIATYIRNMRDMPVRLCDPLWWIIDEDRGQTYRLIRTHNVLENREVLEIHIMMWVLQRRLSGHGGTQSSVAFSPDSKMVAGGGHDGKVSLWETETGALQRTLEGHSGDVHSVVFSPDGKRLASASRDGTVRLRAIQTGTLLHTLEGHMRYAFTVAFSPDGKMLASAGPDGYEDSDYAGTVRLWDAQTGELLAWLRGRDEVQVIRFHTNLRQLWVAAGMTWEAKVYVYEIVRPERRNA